MIANNMGFLAPKRVNDAILAAINVPEDDYPEWDSETTYVTGAWVMVTSGGVHAVYRSVGDGNLGHNPTDESTDPDATPQYWARKGATNRWRMFDDDRQVTTNPESIEVSIDYTGRINSVALLDVDTDTIRIELISTEGVVYDQITEMIDHSMVTSAWSYFFEVRSIRRNLIVRDLPNYANSRLRITMTRPGGIVSCSNLVFGSFTEIGGSRYGAEVGITDYSVKKRDVFGNLYLKARGWNKRKSLDVWVSANRVDHVLNLLTEYRASPLLWIGASGYDAMIIYGIYNKFRILLSYPTYSIMTIDIEGFV